MCKAFLFALFVVVSIITGVSAYSYTCKYGNKYENCYAFSGDEEYCCYDYTRTDLFQLKCSQSASTCDAYRFRGTRSTTTTRSWWDRSTTKSWFDKNGDQFSAGVETVSTVVIVGAVVGVLIPIIIIIIVVACVVSYTRRRQVARSHAVVTTNLTTGVTYSTPQRPGGGTAYPTQQHAYPGQQPGAAPYPQQQPGAPPYPGQQPGAAPYPGQQPGAPPYPGQSSTAPYPPQAGYTPGYPPPTQSDSQSSAPPPSYGEASAMTAVPDGDISDTKTALL